MYRLFVGNISYGATEDSLRSLFAAYGTVETVSIVTQRTGEPRGFGFVEMSNEAEGRKAIAALNGTDFEGRTLYISEARPREDRGFERPRHRY